MHKIIINLGVAAYEQSNVVGERFSADDSKNNLNPFAPINELQGFWQIGSFIVVSEQLIVPVR